MKKGQSGQLLFWLDAVCKNGLPVPEHFWFCNGQWLLNKSPPITSNSRGTSSWHPEGNVRPPRPLAWDATARHPQPPIHPQSGPRPQLLPSKNVCLLQCTWRGLAITTHRGFHFIFDHTYAHMAIFFFQAKFQGTPTLTWCNETAPPIPSTYVSQTSTYTETSSHSNRAPYLTKEGLQDQGHVSCPGDVTAGSWIQQEQRQRWWVTVLQFTVYMFKITIVIMQHGVLFFFYPDRRCSITPYIVPGWQVLISQVQYLQRLLFWKPGCLRWDVMSVSERHPKPTR